MNLNWNLEKWEVGVSSYQRTIFGGRGYFLETHIPDIAIFHPSLNCTVTVKNFCRAAGCHGQVPGKSTAGCEGFSRVNNQHVQYFRSH